MGKRKFNTKPVNQEINFNNIPGHYYDEKRRRLFKLAGNEFSSIQGILTKDKILAEETEKQRVENLQSDLKTTSHKSKGIQHFLNLRQSISRANQFNHEISSSIFCFLKCQGYLDLPTFAGTLNNSILKKITLGPSNDSMAVLVEGCNSRAINLIMMSHSKDELNLHRDETCCNLNLEPKSFNFKIHAKCATFLNDKVVDFTWHNLSDCTIFANSVGFNEPSHIYVCKSANVDVFELNESILSSACSDKNIVAIGHEFGVNIYDINTNQPNIKPVRSLNSNRCQVHSVKFSRNENIIYYGDLRGHIRMCDLREKQIHDFIKSAKRSRVDSFYECQNNIHMLSSFSDGQILLSDVRMKKFVLSYEEHKNDYLKIPIQINPTEEFITAVGTDCYTRIWDFKTSRLLRTIPPPAPAQRSQMPTVCFIPQMSHAFTNAVPGLFLSVDQKVFVYA